MITITGETSDVKITGTPEAVDRVQYFIAVGAFMVAWSTLEYILDLCIATIYERAPRGNSLARRRPVQLSEKLAFFEKAHRDLDPLKAHASDAERIINFMRQLSEVRNAVAHSVAVKSKVLGESHLRRITHGGEEARGNVSTDDIAKLTSAIKTRFAPLIAYGNFVAATYPGTRAD